MRTYRLSFIVLLLGAVFTSQAQEYRYEVGIQVSSATLLGDANKANLLSPIGGELGIIVRRNGNLRWAYLGSVSYAFLPTYLREGGNAWATPVQESRTTSHLAILSLAIEHNFRPYSDKYAYLLTSRLTPFLSAGANVAWLIGNPQGVLAPGLSLGIGMKYKVRNRVNFFALLSGSHYFSDLLDSPNSATAFLNNPYQIPHPFYKGGDGIVSISAGFTYEFGSLRETCTN